LAAAKSGVPRITAEMAARFEEGFAQMHGPAPPSDRPVSQRAAAMERFAAALSRKLNRF
jgi:hypothetical protein